VQDLTRVLNTAVTGPARISDDALAAVEREAVEHGVSRTQGPLFASRNAQLDKGHEPPVGPQPIFGYGWTPNPPSRH